MSNNLSEPINQTVEFSLIREGSLCSMALGLGLTYLRRYDFARKGYFYSGAIMLATGIERLCKIILIYDHRLNNSGGFPNNNYLKSIGHNLTSLIVRCREIERSHLLNIDQRLFDDPLTSKIISNLSDFAIQARYYNLDSLVGIQQSGDEPLKRWAADIFTEIETRHYRVRESSSNELQTLGKILDMHSTIFHSSESGDPITTARRFAEESHKAKTRQKYSMFYCYTIVRYLCEVSDSLESKGQFYPYLCEGFLLFRLKDRRSILSRKTWNPYLGESM